VAGGEGQVEGAQKEAVWYRRAIKVLKTLDGYDLTGTTIKF
jgi:hypothetical protein